MFVGEGLIQVHKGDPRTRIGGMGLQVRHGHLGPTWVTPPRPPTVSSNPLAKCLLKLDHLPTHASRIPMNDRLSIRLKFCLQDHSL